MLVILAAVSLTIPAVQNLVKNKVVSYLKKKTDTEISLERIRISFPTGLQLDKFFIADKKKISEDNKQEYFNMKMKYEVIPILNEYLKDGVFNEKATVKIKEIEQRFA